MALLRLQDSALFSVAINLWKQNVEKNVYINEINWQAKIIEITKSVSTVYPNLPSSVKSSIIGAISVIGNEILLFSLIEPMHTYYGPRSFNICFENICWTPYFTIDRIKAVDAIDKIEIKIADCESPVWKELFSIYFRNVVNEVVQSEIDTYFGNYKYYVFFHSACHCKLRDTSLYRYQHRVHFIDHLHQFRQYYCHGTLVENVFKYSVFSVDINLCIRFFAKLSAETQRKSATSMTKLILTDLNYQPSYKLLTHRLVLIFSHLWNHLDDCERFNIVQNHFQHYYTFLVSFPGTDPLVHFVNWYRPSEDYLVKNRKFLENIAAGIPADCNNYDKHKIIFRLLYNKVGLWLCDIDVVNLLEILLAAKDIDSSVLIVKKMDANKRNKLLDVVSKIWCDLWKEFIDQDTFLTFYFEVRSQVMQSGNEIESC